jgi:uncharacterized protein
LRIEVGLGLERSIPDSLAKRVIDEFIVPQFRVGAYYEGIRDGLRELMQAAPKKWPDSQ